MPTLELAFLGSPEVRLHGRAVGVSIRKALALLAYLVCEPGSHPREKLAAIFWPDHDEPGGRTALRKALGTLNDLLGEEQPAFLIASREALGFNPDSSVYGDVFDLMASAKLVRSEDTGSEDLRTQLEAVSNRFRGEFLAGFSLPETLEFEEWLEVKREGVRRDVDTVLHKLSRLQAEAKKFEAALATARRRVQLDAMNEAAHRAVIELHLETGDRSAALEAYNACQTVLERELGIPPAAETLALVERARSGASSSQTQTVTVIAPVALQTRPVARATTNSVFVGREREWSMLEEAWNENLIAYVCGEPGSGKSRLMLEFLQARGAFVTLENRPGDAGVPYASLARHLRSLFKSQSVHGQSPNTQTVTLEPWVQSELARILPEMGQAPEPIQSEQGKLRFYQAIHQGFQTVIQANPNLTVLLYDDAQFTDTSSGEATRFVLEQLEPEARAKLRIVYGYRKGELSPEAQERINQSLVSGEGVLVDLEPLNATALSAMLAGSSNLFANEELAGISESLQRFTGGNPLFVLETLKEMMETKHEQTLTAQTVEALRTSSQLPRSKKVNQVITRRLERLSKPAKDLVRVAAVMGQEYTLERAAKVLEANQIALAEASEELEVMGFVQGNRFTHDLLFEAAVQEIPRSAKALLHSRVLDALEEFAEIPDRTRSMSQSAEPFLEYPHASYQVSAITLMDHAIASGNRRQIFIQSIKAGRSAAQVYNMQLTDRCFSIAKETLFEAPSILNFNSTEDEEVVSVFFVSYLYNLNKLKDFSNARKICKEFIKFAKSNKLIELELDFMISATKTSSYQFFDSDEAIEILKYGEILLENHPNNYFSSGIYDKFADIYLVGKSKDDIKTRLKLHTQNTQKALDFAEKITEEESKSGYFSQFISKKNYIAEITTNLTYAYYQAGELRESMQTLLRFENLDLKISDKTLNWSEFFKMQSFTYHAIGELEKAKDLSQKAIEIADGQWSPHAVIWACKPLWNVYLEYGFYEKIIQKHDSFLKEEDYSTKISLFQSKADTFLLLGQIDLALHYALQAHEINELHSSYAVGNFMQSAICAAHTFLGHWDDAADWAKRAQAAREQHFMNEPPRCYYWHLETHALLRTVEIGQIRTEMKAREAFAQQELHHRYRVPHLRSQAVLEHHEGRCQDAISSLTLSLEIATEIGLRTECWQLESDIAHIHDQMGNHKEATSARSRATQIRDMIASWITEDAMRQTYLEFTQKQIDLPIWKWE